MRICSIGCGDMADRGHGPAFQKYAAEHIGTILAGCCDINAERAEAFRKKFGFSHAYTDMDEMIAKEKPDAVSVLVPVSLTEQIAVHILKKQIPVIMEKPPGLNAEQTMNIIRTAEENNVPHAVAFNRRSMPVVQALLEKTKDAGISYTEYMFYRYNRQDADFSTTAIHAIDTVQYLNRSPYRTVSVTYRPVPDFSARYIFLDCTFENGAAARISLCPCSGVVAERVVMHGGNRMYSAELPFFNTVDGHGSLLVAENGKAERFPQEDVPEFIENGFYEENRKFFESVRNGEIPENPVRSGLRSVEIADGLRRNLTYMEW